MRHKFTLHLVHITCVVDLIHTLHRPFLSTISGMWSTPSCRTSTIGTADTDLFAGGVNTIVSALGRPLFFCEEFLLANDRTAVRTSLEFHCAVVGAIDTITIH